MKRECILSGVQFDTQDPHAQVSPAVAEAIVQLIKRDKSLRKEVSAEILGDTESIREIAKHVLSVRASEVGLGTPGTLGEFFRELRDSISSKKA